MGGTVAFFWTHCRFIARSFPVRVPTVEFACYPCVCVGILQSDTIEMVNNWMNTFFYISDRINIAYLSDEYRYWDYVSGIELSIVITQNVKLFNLFPLITHWLMHYHQTHAKHIFKYLKSKCILSLRLRGACSPIFPYRVQFCTSTEDGTIIQHQAYSLAFNPWWEWYTILFNCIIFVKLVLMLERNGMLIL